MSQGKPLSILIVDDDLGDQLMIKRALERGKIENRIFIANDGIQALEMLRDENSELSWPYVVLLDLNMPRMDGLEFLDEIRADPELQKAIVFVLSTSESDKDMLAAYSKIIAGYVFKRDVLTDFHHLTRMIDGFSILVKYPV